MVNKNQRLTSEEIIFYLDLVSDFIKFRSLAKAIKNYIEEKNQIAPSSFGVVIFQDNDNPITLYGKEDSDLILDTLKEAWETRERDQSYFENGLFEILSYCLRESRTSDKTFRVIVLSDTPSTLPDDYHNALYDILLKIKPFSIYIDIIRLGDQKFYPDDVKLKVITNETNGGTFYCRDHKRFSSILISLTQTKDKYATPIQDLKADIMEEDKTFYEKLAAHLLSLTKGDEKICILCEKEACPHEKEHSVELGKCYNCSSVFHRCCAAEYSIENSIGPFRHIFRCPICDTLLLLEEEYIKELYIERFKEKEKVEEVKPVQEISQEKEVSKEIKSEETEKIMKEKKPPEDEVDGGEEFKKVRVGGFFGKEVMFRKQQGKKKPKDSLLEPVLKQKTEKVENREKVSITSLKPPKKKKSIKLCPICGAMVKFGNVCPTCGSEL
ncbi:MAG: hypothetical protein BAJALOKI2v1_290036 [Promethearchaeota archaeon]|nr:MAG: hypothetical protein BAJALOKI2v1_290036 [Candidatus Lokiarchaeota archaeon]